MKPEEVIKKVEELDYQLTRIDKDWFIYKEHFKTQIENLERKVNKIESKRSLLDRFKERLRKC